MELIGLVGFAGCGKSTVGDYIQNNYGFTPISFADSLKDCLAVIFGWDRQLLEGSTKGSRIWREQVDEWWALHLGIPKFTPRYAMTHFGTDVMRKWFHDEIWILNVERRLSNMTGPVIITDCRFPNEFKLVRRLSGHLIRVERGDPPAWYDDGMKAARGDLHAINRMRDQHKVHESEWRWLPETTDALLDNSADLAHLYEQINDMMALDYTP